MLHEVHQSFLDISCYYVEISKTSYKHVRNTLVIHMHVLNNSSIIKGIYQITCVIWIHYPTSVYSDKIDIVILVSGSYLKSNRMIVARKLFL